MTANVFPESLVDDVRSAMSRSPEATFAVVGLGPVAYDLRALFLCTGQQDRFLGIYDPSVERSGHGHHPLHGLEGTEPTYVAIAVDEGKVELLRSLDGLIPVETRILFAGQRQYDFVDPRFDRAIRAGLVPSFATGYPEVLVHIFE